MVNVLIKKASKCNARGRYEFGRLDKNLAMFYFSAAIGFLSKAEKEIENSVGSGCTSSLLAGGQWDCGSLALEVDNSQYIRFDTDYQ
ncbi:MAG: hypothetical protein IKT93_01150 [Clostridia bacterium]|nr:hypothetical protein [Clostridia bacterium]